MGSESNIKGGCFQIARQIFTSPVWTRDPDTFRLFVWIIGNANFQSNENAERGELLTSHGELAQALTTYHRNTPRTLSLKQIRDRLKWLVGEGMIKTTPIQSQKRRKVRGSVRGSVAPKSQGGWSGGGVRIVVVNYDTYQTLDNYKVRGVGQGGWSGGESGKGHTTQDKQLELLTNSDPKNDNKNDIKEKGERTGKPSLSSLLERYPDQDLVSKTIEALKTTRKTGRIADPVLIRFSRPAIDTPSPRLRQLSGYTSTNPMQTKAGMKNIYSE